MDVIFTIVSRNYAAQAATLMRSVAAVEPGVKRVVVATDGPISQLEPLAEVIDANDVGAPFAAMCVYYDALELNTAVKPYVFGHLMSRPGMGSVTYLDPDIVVFKPLDAVRAGLAQAQLMLTPHILRPLLGDANPNDRDLLRAGIYNLGFAAARNEPKIHELMRWWADRCRFDCRVDLAGGLFTDQKWMDLSPGFVDSLHVHRRPDLNLAYWNLEGRTLERAKDGWRVDGEPLGFFHFSGFDPHRPKVLSKHQNRVSVAAGSPLSELLADYAKAMLANGHATTSATPYLHNRFASGRVVGPLMRRKALRAARAGEPFAGGLSDETEAWFDAPDPEMTEPGLPDVTRLMEQVWFENPAADPFERATAEGRLGFHQWFADNAAALGADAQAVAAAQALAKRAGGSARAPDASVWRDTPAPGGDWLAWFREPAPVPRVCLALLAARGDLRQRFGGDPDGLLAWCLGPEAAAGRFAPDLLPPTVIRSLAEDTALLHRAASMAERGAAAADLQLRLSAGFGVGERARWPEILTAPLREPHIGPAEAHPAPFVQLFISIWDQRPDLRRLYPLNTPLSRLRYLRWLLAGGFREYGIEFSALPSAVRDHPMMRLARFSVRSRITSQPAKPSGRVERLVVVESREGSALPAGALGYDAGSGQFFGTAGAAGVPAEAALVCFTTPADLVPADVVALHAKGVRWSRAVGVWRDPPPIGSIGRGFVDEVWPLEALAGNARG